MLKALHGIGYIRCGAQKPNRFIEKCFENGVKKIKGIKGKKERKALMKRLKKHLQAMLDRKQPQDF